LIKPLLLGNKSLPVNVIQGPLAGVSCAPFRLLTWRYSKPAFSCTEMISCKTILHQSQASLARFLKKDPEEGPVCFQLSSNNPAELAEATRRITDVGADFIDLNCGCPVKKIRQKGAGSRLLSDSVKLYHLIRAMKEHTHLPVSIKIRVQGNSDEKFNEEIANVVSEAGADFLIVHGRHWTERYDTPCRHDEIKFFVDRLTIPVIGNGDVACLPSLITMLETGCAGVMIGRAGVGQPWLIAKLIAEMKQENFVLPSPHEIGAMFMEHVTGLHELLGNDKFALLQARQFAKYYARGLASKSDFCKEINLCEDIATLSVICRRHFT
jgi:tRNA-dihydrouridine synthase B